MPGACAVCRVPLAKGEKFVLVGPEVVHPQCVGGTTALTRLKQQLIELKRYANNLEIDVRNERQHGENLAAARQRELADIADLRSRLSAQQVLAAEYKAQRDAARSERDYHERQLIAAMDERDSARRTVRQMTMASTQPAAQPTAQPNPESKDERDPTEVRFSLLELDGS